MGHGAGHRDGRRGGKKLSGRATWMGVGILGIVAALGLTACSSTKSDPTPVLADQASGQANQPQQPAAPAVVKPAASITLSPAAGATDVAPGDPIKVTVAGGSIGSVTLTNPDGRQVAGAVSSDKLSWSATEALGYGKTYTWAGSVVGADGKTSTLSGSFTTVKPKRTIRAKINT